MSKVFDVPTDLLITHLATDLKENQKVVQPAFVPFVKTGAHRERSPQDPNWYYVRMASILRRVYVDGPVGTESLRTYYGHRKARGTKPSEFRKAGGKVIRSCLQALEKLGFIEKDKNKDGRKVTGKGESYLQAQAVFVEKHAVQWKKEIKERQARKAAELAKRNMSTPKEEKRDMQRKDKKKKPKEENVDDPTAVKIKRKNK